MVPYSRLDQPLEVPVEAEEETRAPTVSEARAKFDQVEDVPPKKVTRVEIQPQVPQGVPRGPKVQPKPKAPVPEIMPKKIVPPAKRPAPVARPDTAAQEGVKSPSPRLLIMIISTSCMLSVEF